ncbi:MAG: helix-turn-helix transcriptional regulator, partial [Bacillati bacterium ANGP1]
MSLGLRIRQLRQSRGLTQQQLGSPDLSKSFISLVERDRTRPSVATLAFLARRLGTSVDALLGQEGHMPETAAASLLALSDDATRKRDVATAAKLLDAAEFLGEKFALEETKREAALQRAQVAFEQQAFEDAWARLAASKDDAESARDHWRQGRALVLMGRIKIRARDYREAADLLERALAVLRTARASRDPVRAHALIFLGTSLVWLNRLEDALRRYREAAASDVAKRDPAVRGRAEWGIGWVQRKL